MLAQASASGISIAALGISIVAATAAIISAISAFRSSRYARKQYELAVESRKSKLEIRPKGWNCETLEGLGHETDDIATSCAWCYTIEVVNSGVLAHIERAYLAYTVKVEARPEEDWPTSYQLEIGLLPHSKGCYEVSQYNGWQASTELRNSAFSDWDTLLKVDRIVVIPKVGETITINLPERLSERLEKDRKTIEEAYRAAAEITDEEIAEARGKALSPKE